MLTGAGRGLSLTPAHGPQARRARSRARARRHRARAPRRRPARRVAERWGRVDGVVHAIAYGPPATLGDDFMGAQWDDVAVAVHVSAYSLKALADAFVPLMTDGGAFVGLDFDNRQAWPAYNWMGVAKSALQSVNRYLAKELGPQRHPLQPRRRRAGAHDGGQEHPRLLQVRGRLGRAGPARLGHHRPGAGRPVVRRPAVGLLPGHDRRDRPRRRRLPRRRRRSDAQAAGRRAASTRPIASTAPTRTIDEAGQPEVERDAGRGRRRPARRAAPAATASSSTLGESSASAVAELADRGGDVGQRRIEGAELVGGLLQLHAEGAQLVGHRLQAVGDRAQVLGCRRPVTRDEALDRPDDVGDPVGEAAQPLGRHRQVVLGGGPELVQRRLAPSPAAGGRPRSRSRRRRRRRRARR